MSGRVGKINTGAEGQVTTHGGDVEGRKHTPCN